MLVLTIASLFLASGPRSHCQSIYTDGHGDIGVAFDGSAMEPHWHIGGGTVDGTARSDEEFAAGDLIAALDDSALATRQSNSSGRNWDPIGVAAGETLWRIGTVSTAGVPFLGFAAQEGFNPAEWSTGIFFTLTALAMPSGGAFSVYHFDPDTGDLVFDMASTDGISSADVFEIPVGAHSHFNLAFTKSGDYHITFEISGTHSSLGLLAETETFTFRVVPEPSTALVVTMGLVSIALRRRR